MCIMVDHSAVAVGTVIAAELVVPAVASPAVRYLALVVVLLPAVQAPVLLQQLFRLVLLLRLAGAVIYAVFLHLVVQILVELAQLLHAVRNAVPEVLEGFWFFVPLAVDFQQRLIVGPDDIDAQAIPFSTLRMVGPPAALIVAGNGDADHVAADCADVCVFLAAIDEVHPFHTLRCEVVGALRPQHVARDMHVLPHPLSLWLFSHYPKLEVRFALLELFINQRLLKLWLPASWAISKKCPFWTGHN